MAQRKKTSRKKVTKISEGSPYAREMNLERELIVIAKPDAELRATRSEVKSAAGADVSDVLQFGVSDLLCPGIPLGNHGDPPGGGNRLSQSGKPRQSESKKHPACRVFFCQV